MSLKEIAARCWKDCQIAGTDRDARGEGIILMYLQQAIEEGNDQPDDPETETDIRQLVRTLSRDELHKLFSKPCKYKGCRANTKKVNCFYCNQHHYIIQELERRDKNA